MDVLSFSFLAFLFNAFFISQIHYVLVGCNGSIGCSWKPCLWPVLKILAGTRLFLKCHVSKSLDLTQAVPTTGTSRTFSLQKVFPQPKTCSLWFSPAGTALICIISQSILTHILSQLQLPYNPIERCKGSCWEHLKWWWSWFLLSSEVLVF